MNMQRLINKIENEKYSLLLGFLALFSAITVRNIFESVFEGSQTLGFSPITSRSFYMVFSHFPLFYISIFLWFLLIFHLITKENLTRIARALLWGMWVIVITPFLDIFVSRGSGYRLTYLKGVEEFTQIHKFFDFTRDLIQSSWGQRIEIILVLIGAFLYVFIKTKNPFKSIMTSIIFYLIIFLHGVLPNTVARIPSYFGFSIIKPATIITGGILPIDSQNYSIVFLISILIVGLLIIKRYDKKFFYQIFNLKPSILLLIFACLGIIYGILLMRPHFSFIFYSPVHYLVFILVLFSMHLISLTSLMSKSSYKFTILIIFLLFSAIAVGPVFLIITGTFFIITNLIKIMRPMNWATTNTDCRPKKRHCSCLIYQAIISVLVFIASFSTIFQEYTLIGLVPNQKIENYGRRLAAWNYFLNKDYEKALKQYSETFSVKGDDEIILRIGQCYLGLGEIEKGLGYLKTINKPNYENILALGDAYIQKGANQEALSLYYYAVDENIEPAEFLLKIAQLNAREGEKQAMEKALVKGLSFNIPRFKFYQIKGDFYLKTGDYKIALDMYNKALFYNSRATLAYAGKGTVYYYQGDLIQAEKDFLKALKFDSRNDALYNNLGAVYLLSQNYPKAKEQFTKSVNINPSQVEGYYNLGLIAERSGQIEEALKMFKKALTINPNFNQALQAIKRIKINE